MAESLTKEQMEEVNKLQKRHFNENVDLFEPPLPKGVPERLKATVKASRLRQGERILDVGTGTGILIPYILKYDPSEIHVCDLAEVFAASPQLNLTLDLGHAELLSEKNTSFGFLEKYPDRIKHIHLHDNHGGCSPDDDLHLPPGEGKIDFQKIFQTLHAVQYRDTVRLELRPSQIETCLGYVKRLVYPTEYQEDAAI